MTGGCFITFEGIEGSGKSTQIQFLEAYLETRGLDVIRLREPGGTDVGNRIREVLLDPASANMEAETEMLLFAASRAQLVREKIEPALAAGKVVLCDRFLHSSLAYQGTGRGLGRQQVLAANTSAIQGRLPDRIVLLDLPPEEALERVRNRAGLDRIEQEDVGFHSAVRQGFLDEAEQDTGRFVVVKATGNADTIHQRVLDGLKKHLDDLSDGHLPAETPQ